MSLFWQLPEPARYLRAIIDDLRAGSNVVLALPDHTPDGCAAALGTALTMNSLPALVELQPNGSAPIATMHELLALGPCSPGATAFDLCDNHGFRRRVIHVQSFTPASWPPWSNFLIEYEDACRQLELPDRTLFVVTLCGELAVNVPTQLNLLRVHPWLARMDGLNIRLHAAELLGASNIQIPWQRQLAVATLAELALWDPEVVAAGASLSLVEILEPEPWLTQIATARGWSLEDDPKLTASQWRGLRQSFDGRPRTHSAWLALAGRAEALSQRLWTAQVAALFPFLERHRRGFIHCHRKMFIIPWPTKFGQIDQLKDLELNHIADQLRPYSNGGLRDVFRFVCWLRDIRNELAHFNSVQASILLDSRFQSRMENFLSADDD
jgi:hypothetical protein